MFNLIKRKIERLTVGGKVITLPITLGSRHAGVLNGRMRLFRESKLSGVTYKEV